MSDEFDIAIVGMSGRFPGAGSVEEFWRNVAGGVESIRRYSDPELLEAGVAASAVANPAYVKAAPALDAPGRFDAAFFGYSPVEAKTTDPQHRLLLELAHEALEHAGYDPERQAGRIGVFAGCALNTYYTSAGLNARLAEDYIPTLIGNDKDFLSTRVSYKLNLKGPSITVQSACSTSMVAVHLARQSLLCGETDMALAGAVSVRVPHHAGYFCDGGGVTSPDARVRAFDAAANGTVFGSGGGILVLKRLADALKDGDTIHAVIKGSAVNNDGSEKAGYTAPSVASQADAVVEALANAGVEADSITYVEAHGSGTPVGDPIEMSALTRAFRTSTSRSGYCAIGSVKTNIGHLDAAAAVAGMIKTVLALEHRQLPPSLHYTQANPEIDFPATPFYVNTRLREWESAGPRRAGVMSTGMGGTNAHIVLEEAPPAAAGEPESARPPYLPQYLLVLSAKTETALDRAAQRLREFLERHEDADLADVAYTLQMGRKAFAHRRYVVCTGREDAIAALGDPQRVTSARADEARRPVILLLPGIGDHYVGMGYDLYQSWPVFREAIDRCAQILEPLLGADLRRIIYPESRGWVKDGTGKGIDLKKMLGRGAAPADPDAARLNQTLYAQPALFAIEYATARLWQALGVVPEAIVGHSMGEYVAACLSGVLALEDALRLIATRARLVNELPQGAMLAVTLAESELLPLLPAGVSISLINGPQLSIVAGPPAAVAEFERTLGERGVICRHVQNAHAFHSRMLDPIAQAFEAEVRKVRLGAPAIPYVSNVTGTWITRAEAADPAYWPRHATRTARFGDALRELWRYEQPVLLEAGPGRTLGVLAMQHPDRGNGNAAVVSSLRHDYEQRPDVEFVLQSMGKLWLAGVTIDWEKLPGGARRRVALPTYPFEGEHHWLAPVAAPATAPRSPGLAPRSTALVGKNPDPRQWLYVPSWKRDLARTLGVRELTARLGQGGKCLVFADDTGLGAVLTARLKAAGQDVVVVKAGKDYQRTDADAFVLEPANPGHYDALVRALQSGQALPDRIIHAWSVTGIRPALPEGAAFAHAQSTGFYSLLFLAQALAAHGVGHAIAICALSNNVQDVWGTETLCPEKATLLGPCMVIQQEYPNLRMKSIDLDFSGLAAELEPAADLVLGECAGGDASMFVAYRNRQRWVRTFEPVALEQPAPGASVFRERGTYLITGGLGNIGVAICGYLARNYAANLVLVGRSTLPDPRGGANADDRVTQAMHAIRRIEALGSTVSYVAADVADAQGMRGAVEHARARFGALHGVIHAAGIVGDDGYREIKDCDHDNCERHFHAKAHGLRTLEDALAGESPDFCMLVSSLTSFLGGIGHVAYASSNLYMDAYVRRHNRTHPRAWLTVNWDLFRFQHQAAAQSGLGKTLAALGHSAIEAMPVLETVLAARDAGQLVVSTGELGARIDQWIKLESLNAGAANEPARPARAGAAAGEDAPRDETEQQIARIWQDALGIEAIGVNESFARLGGHSLLAVRIVAELRKAFQIDLPVRALFEAPTIAGLASHIKEHILADIEALSDEEARRLVSNE